MVALKRLDDHGLAGQVIITGQDAELEACRNIIQNRQTMTVYKPLKLLAENAAELSFKMAKGDKLSLPSTTIENGQKSVPAILLEPVAVDKENMKNKIIAEGFYTEAQVYN
ncbi:MAG: hypothetical protein HC905_30075 [Bacteroidales bacterium]|nr:hypothetical protein [Bacteroidales bacterium]